MTASDPAPDASATTRSRSVWAAVGSGTPSPASGWPRPSPARRRSRPSARSWPRASSPTVRATRRFEAAMAERHGTEHAVAFANGTVALAAMYLAAGHRPGRRGDRAVAHLHLHRHLGAARRGHAGLRRRRSPTRSTSIPTTSPAASRHAPGRSCPVHYGGQAGRHGPLPRAGRRRRRRAPRGRRRRPTAPPSPADRSGSWGDAAMFSFTPTKNITTGEGADRHHRRRRPGPPDAAAPQPRHVGAVPPRDPRLELAPQRDAVGHRRVPARPPRRHPGRQAGQRRRSSTDLLATIAGVTAARGPAGPRPPVHDLHGADRRPAGARPGHRPRSTAAGIESPHLLPAGAPPAGVRRTGPIRTSPSPTRRLSRSCRSPFHSRLERRRSCRDRGGDRAGAAGLTARGSSTRAAPRNRERRAGRAAARRRRA